MICAPWAAASRTNCSCFAIMDSLSPVQVVWVSAARTTVMGVLHRGVCFVIVRRKHFSYVSAYDVGVNIDADRERINGWPIGEHVKAVATEVQDASPHGIAAAIARLITSGELAPGDRLPTVRELAADLGVSPATVSHAWKALSSVGLIVSRGRSGSFVTASQRKWLPPRFQGLADQLQGTRLDLSTGTPDPDLLPALGPAFSRVSTRAGTTSYLDPPVIPELEQLLRE